jgi:hypothetical protein
MVWAIKRHVGWAMYRWVELWERRLKINVRGSHADHDSMRSVRLHHYDPNVCVTGGKIDWDSQLRSNVAIERGAQIDRPVNTCTVQVFAPFTCPTQTERTLLKI